MTTTLRAEAVEEPNSLQAGNVTIPPIPPRVGRSGMGYIWDIPEYGVSVRLDYIAPRGRELSGEFEIHHNGKFLLSGIHSLNSTESRDRLSQALSKRTNGVVPWDRLLSLFCAAVMRKEREGASTQVTFDAPIPRTTYLIDRIVQEHKPNLLFGPGGSAKGFLAIATCIAVAASRGIGPLTVKPAVPFYFDWEDDFETFNARVKMISAGIGIAVPHIPYRRMHGKLSDNVISIARAMDHEHATYGVIDSMSACSGSPGSGETWDSIAHRMFDALDHILDPNGSQMTWLLIGHVTGDSASRAGDIAGKAFGSIQLMNRARCAWEMRASQDDGSDKLSATLYHGKWNHTGKKAPIGLSFTFDEDSVRIESGVATRLRNTMVDKLWDYFDDHGKASLRALSLALRSNESDILASLNVHTDKFSRDETGFWNIIGRNELNKQTDGNVSTANDSKNDLPWA